MFISFISMCFGIPVDLVANLIYLATEIDPIALVGLTGYLIILPIVGGILMYIV